MRGWSLKVLNRSWYSGNLEYTSPTCFPYTIATDKSDNGLVNFSRYVLLQGIVCAEIKTKWLCVACSIPLFNEYPNVNSDFFILIIRSQYFWAISTVLSVDSESTILFLYPLRFEILMLSAGFQYTRTRCKYELL